MVAGSVLVVMNVEVLVGALVVVTGIGAIGNKCIIYNISYTDIISLYTRYDNYTLDISRCSLPQ